MSKPIARIIPGWTAALLLLGSAGCGNTPSFSYNENVKGTIKLNGAPLGNVRLTFFPDLGSKHDAPSSTAFTDEAGRFELMCGNRKSGAVIAKHRVTIALGRGQDEIQLPAAYALAGETPLKMEVTKDQSNYDLEVKTEP